MDATSTFLLAVSVAAVMWVAVMIYGSARGKHLSSPTCPECGCELRVIREPTSIKQVIWGGWTCPDCGCHIDKWACGFQSETLNQTLRSVSDHHVFVVCRDGTFYELPEAVRKQGPWQVMHRGEVTKLKRNYRVRLARDGYALVTSALAVFKPEA